MRIEVMRSGFVVIAATLVTLGANDGRCEGWPPDAFEDVTVTVYVCAAGDFAVLFNEDALERLDECSEGVPGTRVTLGNIKGDTIRVETGPDGTAVLGPIAMSRVYTGSMRFLAEHYACLGLEMRIAEERLRPGENILAVRLDQLETGEGEGECKADEPGGKP